MECESGVIGSTINELDSYDMKGDQMESEGGVTRSIIDELHSLDFQGTQWKMKVDLLEVSLMKFIFRISKEIE